MASREPNATGTVLGHRLHAVPLAATFALLAASIALAAATATAWWLMPVAIIGPGLSFLAGIGATPDRAGLMPRRVVPVYNAVHHPVVLLPPAG